MPRPIEHLIVTYHMTDRTKPHFSVGVPVHGLTRYLAYITEEGHGPNERPYWSIEWHPDYDPHTENEHRTMKQALEAVARAETTKLARR